MKPAHADKEPKGPPPASKDNTTESKDSMVKLLQILVGASGRGGARWQEGHNGSAHWL